MSFSGQIKEELSRNFSTARHCQIAELAAMIQYGGSLTLKNDGSCLLQIQTENKNVARKCFTLWRKTFKINADIIVRRSIRPKGGWIYLVQTDHQMLIQTCMDMLKISLIDMAEKEINCLTDARLIKNSCCKRAFLRGAYLMNGSMSDPNKSYHLELVCHAKSHADQLMDILLDFGLSSKYVLRKKNYVVYLKEGENISEFLSVIEAYQGMMEFENARIVKDMRGMVNRKVNCEIANINKTVSAAARQINDIKWIQAHGGLEQMPDQLVDMAYVRLEHPESSLEELGKLLSPPVGKSGVNHRLRKISEFAKELKI